MTIVPIVLKATITLARRSSIGLALGFGTQPLLF
jgi:hypothetical protein